MLLDSTALELCRPGKWLVEKHSTRTRRSSKKLHLALDAETGEIVAASITAKRDRLRAHTNEHRATEVDIAVYTLNRMLELERPNYVHVA